MKEQHAQDTKCPDPQIHMEFRGKNFLAIDAISGQKLLSLTMVKKSLGQFLGRSLQIIGICTETVQGDETIPTTPASVSKETIALFHAENEKNMGEVMCAKIIFFDRSIELLEQVRKNFQPNEQKLKQVKVA